MTGFLFHASVVKVHFHAKVCFSRGERKYIRCLERGKHLNNRSVKKEASRNKDSGSATNGEFDPGSG